MDGQESLNPTTATTRDAPDVKTLSCTNCRRRKIKCDRNSPCSPCKRSGKRCVSPAPVRVRRAQQGGRDETILRRIDHLEALVGKMGENMTTPSSDNGLTFIATEDTRHFRNRDTPKRIVFREQASLDNFWARLGGEVNGLRRLLEAPAGNSNTNDDGYGNNELEASMSLSPNLVIYQLPPHFVIPQFDRNLSQPETSIPSHYFKALTDTYFVRVDPIFKILHRPSTLAAITASTQNFTAPSNDSVTELLMFCMYFAAVTSLSPDECRQTYHQESQILSAKLTYRVHRAFARENLLNTNDITVLQAFTIYLGALRIHNNRSTWTLFAIALRIAQSLRLHNDPSTSNASAFETQQRRLLWWQIMALDIRCAEDRGTQPMVFDGSFDTRLPLNINDQDYGPETNVPIYGYLGLTDMVLTYVTHKLVCIFQKLLFPGETSIMHKEQLIKTLSHELESLYFGECDPRDPNQWFLVNTGRLLILKMWLTLRYPHLPGDERTWMGANSEQTLVITVSILETMIHMYDGNPMNADFKWTERAWVQWHPLAVMLSELCIQTEGPLVDRAWASVRRFWNKYEEHIADSRDARLRKAIKGLLKKAQTARQKAAGTRTAHPKDSTSHGGIPPIPGIQYDLPEALLYEYNSSTLFGGRALVHPRLGLGPQLGSNYNMPATTQSSINAKDSNDLNGGDWQQFLTDSRTWNWADNNTFDIQPITPGNTWTQSGRVTN